MFRTRYSTAMWTSRDADALVAASGARCAGSGQTDTDTSAVWKMAPRRGPMLSSHPGDSISGLPAPLSGYPAATGPRSRKSAGAGDQTLTLPRLLRSAAPCSGSAAERRGRGPMLHLRAPVAQLERGASLRNWIVSVRIRPGVPPHRIPNGRGNWPKPSQRLGSSPSGETTGEIVQLVERRAVTPQIEVQVLVSPPFQRTAL